MRDLGREGYVHRRHKRVLLVGITAASLALGIAGILAATVTTPSSPRRV